MTQSRESESKESESKVVESKVIAICGGIGAGKSLCAHFLSKKGYVCINCDDLARQAAQQSDVLNAVEEKLGKQFVKDGQLCRKKLRQFCFEDSQRLDLLNAIFLEIIMYLLKGQIAQNRGQRVIFVEVSNYNKSLDGFFSETWLVDASLETKVKRIIFRDNCSRESALQIIDKQTLPKNPDRIIVNNGTPSDIHCLLQQIIADYPLD